MQDRSTNGVVSEDDGKEECAESESPGSLSAIASSFSSDAGPSRANYNQGQAGSELGILPPTRHWKPHRRYTQPVLFSFLHYLFWLVLLAAWVSAQPMTERSEKVLLVFAIRVIIFNFCFFGDAFEQIREGETIYKRHRSYDLMVQLKLGIQWTISFINNSEERNVEQKDFMKSSNWRTQKVAFPQHGSKETPIHPAPSFTWKDYYPMVFHKLRQHFSVDSRSYLMSICGDKALRCLGSPGKSGSVFFISGDDRYIIKTMRKNEVRHLQSIIWHYYEHVRRNPDTLLTKFYGLYRIKGSTGRKVFNLFWLRRISLTCRCDRSLQSMLRFAWWLWEICSAAICGIIGSMT